MVLVLVMQGTIMLLTTVTTGAVLDVVVVVEGPGMVLDQEVLQVLEMVLAVVVVVAVIFIIVAVVVIIIRGRLFGFRGGGADLHGFHQSSRQINCCGYLGHVSTPSSHPSPNPHLPLNN